MTPAAARRHITPSRRQADACRRVPRPSSVERPRLWAALVGTSRSLVVLTAPAGYGKSTLLGQWQTVDPRPFVMAVPSATGDCVRELIGAADRSGPPAVIAVDGLDELGPDEAQDVCRHLLAAVPPGGTVAIASRRELPIPLARLRAEDAVVELRAEQLALTRREGEQLLKKAGLELEPHEVSRLLELTEGWPAALQLAARAIREQDAAPGAAETFDGHDALLADYVREEGLLPLGEADRAFLRRTSLLERLDGDACDAVMDAEGSALRLRALARASVPLVRLDRSEREYRHLRLVGEALRSELHSVEPHLESVLHLRAGTWFEEAGELEQAIDHAVAARDADRAGRLLAERAVAHVAGGTSEHVERWLQRLGERTVATHPVLASVAAISRLASGDHGGAERWAGVATDGGDDAFTRFAVSLVRCWDAPLRSGRTVGPLPGTAADGEWRALACLVEGTARCLADDAVEAAARLDEGARTASVGAPVVRSLCLAELAFLALRAGDMEQAEALAGRGRAALGRTSGAPQPLSALTFAISAVAAAHCGRADAARDEATIAARALAALEDPPGWYAALTRAAMARVHLKLSDAVEARRLLSQAARDRRQVDDAPALEAWIEEGWELADDFAAGPVACPTTLTMAELRVLRLLPSHMTFREIAGRLHVSPNTVKTQAHAVYRKLDARSRSEAVGHAAALGLVSGPGFTP